MKTHLSFVLFILLFTFSLLQAKIPAQAINVIAVDTQQDTVAVMSVINNFILSNNATLSYAYDLEKFKSVLDKSNLQWQSKDGDYEIISDLEEISTDYFYLTDNKYMTFEIADAGQKRVELREEETWMTSTNVQLLAKVKLYTPIALKEYTFTQLFNKTKNSPSARLLWHSRRSGESNHLWAFVKTDAGERKVDLGEKLDIFMDVNISIVDFNLTIKVNNELKLTQNIENDTYWEGDFYFKAGAYISGSINNDVPEGSRGVRVEFESLTFDSNVPLKATLTITPTTTTNDSESVEVHGKIGSIVIINGVEMAVIGISGTVIVDLNTSGLNGIKIFNIILVDELNNESVPLVIEIEKVYDYIPKELDDKIVVNFLSHASFGANRQSKELLKEKGIIDWIDTQLALPYEENMHLKRMISLAKKAEPSVNIQTIEEYLADNDLVFNKDEASFKSPRYQMSAWFETALLDEDQLRHKVAYALSQIIVESLAEPTFIRRAEALAVYFDTLTKHAFGNYKDLLLEISQSASMGVYLTYNGNKKEYSDNGAVIYPDENYARELMQLFTIGLVALNSDGTVQVDAQNNPIPTYTQSDVNEIARVFTGWDLQRNNTYGRLSSTQGDYTQPLEFTQEYHDTGAKSILGQSVQAGLSGAEDIEAVIDILMVHSNIAPFVSKQLILRLATSNPSPAYVARVASIFNDNGQGIKGDLKAVTRAIFLDAEFWENESPKKFKEPLVAYTQLLRAFNADVLPRWLFSKSSGTLVEDALLVNDPSEYLGQAPSRAFTVFNFYDNNYIPNDTTFKAQALVAPELQIQTDSMIIKFSNHLEYLLSRLEKRHIINKRGALTDIDALVNANFNTVYYIGTDKILLDCEEEYNVIEEALEGTVDGVFNSFEGIKRVDDTTADANGTTHRDRAVLGLIEHLDVKLTGGLLSSATKVTLFEGYKEAFYGNTLKNAENPVVKIYEDIMLPIIRAIVSSETNMVH